MGCVDDMLGISFYWFVVNLAWLAPKYKGVGGWGIGCFSLIFPKSGGGWVGELPVFLWFWGAFWGQFACYFPHFGGQFWLVFPHFRGLFGAVWVLFSLI